MDGGNGTDFPAPEKPSSAILPPKTKNKKPEATKDASEFDLTTTNPTIDKPGDTASSLTDAYQFNDDEENKQLQEAIRLSCAEYIQEGQKKPEPTEGATALTETSKTKTDSVLLVDQMKGVLYGNCIGDAIGLLTEFMHKDQAQSVCCFFFYNSQTTTVYINITFNSLFIDVR